MDGSLRADRVVSRDAAHQMTQMMERVVNPDAGTAPGAQVPGYVVAGKGLGSSLNSASHGAGRKMGRKAALSVLTKSMRDDYLQKRGVTLLGGGLDESPQAYKDIETVIAAQTELVKVLGKFTPKIVKMASEAGDV